MLFLHGSICMRQHAALVSELHPSPRPSHQRLTGKNKGGRDKRGKCQSTPAKGVRRGRHSWTLECFSSSVVGPLGRKRMIKSL